MRKRLVYEAIIFHAIIFRLLKGRRKISTVRLRELMMVPKKMKEGFTVGWLF